MSLVGVGCFVRGGRGNYVTAVVIHDAKSYQVSKCLRKHAGRSR